MIHDGPWGSLTEAEQVAFSNIAKLFVEHLNEKLITIEKEEKKNAISRYTALIGNIVQHSFRQVIKLKQEGYTNHEIALNLHEEIKKRVYNKFHLTIIENLVTLLTDNFQDPEKLDKVRFGEILDLLELEFLKVLEVKPEVEPEMLAASSSSATTIKEEDFSNEEQMAISDIAKLFLKKLEAEFSNVKEEEKQQTILKYSTFITKVAFEAFAMKKKHAELTNHQIALKLFSQMMKEDSTFPFQSTRVEKLVDLVMNNFQDPQKLTDLGVAQVQDCLKATFSKELDVKSEVKAEPTVANVDPKAHRFSLTDLNTVLIATSVALPVLFEFSRNKSVSSAFTTLLETFGYDSSLDNDHSSPKP